jgi:hypothetical protein
MSSIVADKCPESVSFKAEFKTGFSKRTPNILTEFAMRSVEGFRTVAEERVPAVNTRSTVLTRCTGTDG